jgi:hypothetical protein
MQALSVPTLIRTSLFDSTSSVPRNVVVFMRIPVDSFLLAAVIRRAKGCDPPLLRRKMTQGLQRW